MTVPTNNPGSDAPTFVFLRSLPSSLYERPQIASSLQTFESCLLLISLWRYPHAFTTCVAAIENTLGAYYLSSGKPPTLQELLQRARTESSRLSALPERQLVELRQLRNRIVHSGFSPKDDNATSAALLLTGIPFLATLFQEFFEYDLVDGLLLEFGSKMKMAVDVYGRHPSPAASRYFSILSHQIRWSIRDTFAEQWELETAEEADQFWDDTTAVKQLKLDADRQLYPGWEFCCPVCGCLNSFICQLCEQALDQRQIKLVRGCCLKCGLRVPAECSELLTETCRPELDKARESILKECGLA